MAHPTMGAKITAALITGGSVLGLVFASGAITAPDLRGSPTVVATAPADQPSPPVPEAPQPDSDVSEPLTAPAAPAELTPANEPDVAVNIPQAPVLSGPPPVDEPAQTAASALIIPGFDLLRVEPDGSVVIVGRAAPGAMVQAITGSRELGSAQAAANGDFVIVFEEQLAPGDYNIVLRADDNAGTVATSVQTAIVSIPQLGGDGVLALVEEPGAPSRLISTGEGTTPPLASVPPTQTAQAEVTEDEQTEEPVAAPETVVNAETAPTAADTVRIEAVEIDGETVFVAGQAQPGSRLRVYANDMLLGETVANPDGSFLVQVNRDLPVGDYLVRADILSENGADVLMRAAVPFSRQPGEKLAAIAVQPSVQLPNAAPPIETPDDLTLQAPAAGEADDVEVSLQSPLSAADSSVIIRRGDTLWQISRRVYGRGVKYTTIYNANADQIQDPDRIWPGQIFAVPPTADSDERTGASDN